MSRDSNEQQSGMLRHTPILRRKFLWDCAANPGCCRCEGNHHDCCSSCAGAAPVLAGAPAATGPAAVAAVRQQGLEAGSQAQADVQGNGAATANGTQQHGPAAAAAATVSPEPGAGPGDLGSSKLPLPESTQAGGLACNIAKQRKVMLPYSVRPSSVNLVRFRCRCAGAWVQVARWKAAAAAI